uniref:CCHC-type domain-containing protein n=1 Tax=Crocodylus porosus TaxID=8502 RepID=A0A7M4ETG7_CROPO
MESCTRGHHLLLLSGCQLQSLIQPLKQGGRQSPDYASGQLHFPAALLQPQYRARVFMDWEGAQLGRAEIYRRKFRAKKVPEGGRLRLLVQTLRDLADQWLRLEEHTSQEIVDKIVLEQFVADLMDGTQGWVRCHQPKTVEEALCLAEDYAIRNSGPSLATGPSTTITPWWGESTGREMRTGGYPEVICYQCGEKGHISHFCLGTAQNLSPGMEKHDEKIDCSFGQRWGQGQRNKPVMEVRVGDTIIPTIIETGCSQTMVQGDLVPSHLGSPSTLVSMVCMHSAVYTYPCRRLEFSVLGKTEEIRAGIAKCLSFPMLLGVDWPYLGEVV